VENRPKTRAGLSSCVIGGEIVVLDRDGSTVHQLNSTASYIWERCDGRLTVAEIARDVAKAYGVEPERAASDVAASVTRFQELGLLESTT
jgi:hypothetical protein